LPADEAVHETVAVPEPVTLLGAIEPQARPGGTISVMITLPAKPFNEVTVIVEVADMLTLTWPGDVAVIVKSWN
jgi:hypothetical protein